VRREAVANPMTRQAAFISFAKVYPLYVAKAERKGRTRAEVDEVIRWLTGSAEKASRRRSRRASISKPCSPRRPRSIPPAPRSRG
jgi:hypothetical protein